MAPARASVLASGQHSHSVFTWLSLYVCPCGSSLSKDTNHVEEGSLCPHLTTAISPSVVPGP